ncbi:MAG: anthranilate synthase component I [Acaryochloridaceae cyanobacterium SU_2_1]|nr:anthranilate synthase component I [Acaryochloridaceae cyanobacterium SU_2_1]
MDHLQPWHWRSHPLANRTGADIFAALFRRNNIATLLESPYSLGQQTRHRYSLCAGQPRQINGQVQLWTPSRGEILPCLAQRLQQPVPEPEPAVSPLPFVGGWLGWLGYDLAWEIEQLPWLREDSLPFPVAYWYEPENFAVLDHHQQLLWLATTDPQQLDELTEQLKHPQAQRWSSWSSLSPQGLTFMTNKAEYEGMVEQVLGHIRAGDIFQANLSTRFGVEASLDPWCLYQTLQAINPSPFASYWQTPWGAVVSCSPERLVQLKGRQAQTRPIAGTRSRGTTPTLDQALAQDLLSNLKERAEHTMLVDLERNDLGRVCQWGSVRVDEFYVLEFYSHVMHLVSNITGTLKAKCTPIDLIRSLFPGGTISGCPKVRCLEIIEELEPVRRSLFYGSCGYLDQRGHVDLNILIRTLLVTPLTPTLKLGKDEPVPVQIWGQVGAGIVADSNPEQEWFESLQKAQAQLAALQQINAGLP